MSAVATAAAYHRACADAWAFPDEHEFGADARESASLSIIIPTFNEAGNIAELLKRIASCLGGTDWEAIVVDDDSPDGTAEIVMRLGCRNRRLRCLKRIGRRGLSSACLEGMSESTKRFVAVIDADLQHDEQLLPAMLRVLAAGRLDLVVGSRYLHRDGVAAWSRRRRWLSRAATAMTCGLLAVDLTDPMSGFFMIRRDVVTALAAQLSEAASSCSSIAVADAVAGLSGWRLTAAGAGILAGAVCNYCTTSALVWRRQTRPAHG